MEQLELYRIENFEVGYEVSALDEYVSVGTNLYRNGILMAPIPGLRPFHLHLKDTSNNWTLGYQIISSAECEWVKCDNPTSVFLISVIRDGVIEREYWSLGRPLIARFFDDEALTTGFVPVTSPSPLMTPEPSVDAAPILSLHTEVEDDEMDEMSEETSLNQIVLVSYSLCDNTLLARSPPLNLIAVNRAGHIGIQSGPDMAVFQLLDAHLGTRHLYTINAFAFVQSGKPRRKYLDFSSFAVLAETDSSVHVYWMPGGIEADHACQALIELEGRQEVLGLSILEDSISFIILLPSSIHKYI